MPSRRALAAPVNSGSPWSTFVATPSPTSGGNPDVQDVFVGYGGVARLTYASYVGNRAGDQLWVRSSTDGGAHWGAAIRAVGPTPTLKNAANIVTVGNGMVVVFGRFASPSGGVAARAFT